MLLFFCNIYCIFSQIFGSISVLIFHISQPRQYFSNHFNLASQHFSIYMSIRGQYFCTTSATMHLLNVPTFQFLSALLYPPKDPFQLSEEEKAAFYGHEQ